MFKDLDKIKSKSKFNIDLCIVGAGPAGLSIAHKFINANYSVLVIESGGENPEVEYQELNSGSNSGERFLDVKNSRLRCFGGASRLWAGVCRPYSIDDFEEKSFVKYSGWPINYNDIQKYYKEAAKMLGVDYQLFYTNKWNEIFDKGKLFSKFKRKSSLLTANIFQKSSPDKRNFNTQFREIFRISENVTVLHHATVVSIERNSSGAAVEKINVKSLKGNAAEIIAKKYILATGALENPRLLLTNGEIGNHSGFVGKCFMSHPGFPETAAFFHSSAGECFHSSKDISENANLLFEANHSQRTTNKILRHTISFVESSIKRELSVFKKDPGLLFNISALKQVFDNLDFWAGIKSFACDFGNKSSISKLWKISVGVEQIPDKNNKVTLTNDVDELGVRKLDICWNPISKIEESTIQEATRIFGMEAGATGSGMIKISDKLQNGTLFKREDAINHHIGTTRMSDNPDFGVVDNNCKVHNVSNLFIAGSSVFPTSSCVNPTFTIIAMSLRLADYIKNSFGSNS